jgi:predicted nucleotide-binding protein
LLDGTARARQNVILEIGYFMGQLGKERVRLLVRDNVEIPSDLQGILYEKHDNAGHWKIRILKELLAAGIYVDIESVMNTL